MTPAEERAHAGIEVPGLQNGAEVLRLEAGEAIAALRPDLVLASWLPPADFFARSCAFSSRCGSLKNSLIEIDTEAWMLPIIPAISPTTITASSVPLYCDAGPVSSCAIRCNTGTKSCRSRRPKSSHPC